MLILEREIGESITIDGDIVVTVRALGWEKASLVIELEGLAGDEIRIGDVLIQLAQFGTQRVRFAIDAPKTVRIVRTELIRTVTGSAALESGAA
ncbi:MAG: carbon storage regulator [Planctomycetaceae bacterium]